MAKKFLAVGFCVKAVMGILLLAGLCVLTGCGSGGGVANSEWQGEGLFVSVTYKLNQNGTWEEWNGNVRETPKNEADASLYVYKVEGDTINLYSNAGEELYYKCVRKNNTLTIIAGPGSPYEMNMGIFRKK
jgi:hypothetical protein